MDDLDYFIFIDGIEGPILADGLFGGFALEGFDINALRTSVFGSTTSSVQLTPLEISAVLGDALATLYASLLDGSLFTSIRIIGVDPSATRPMI